MSIIRKAKKSLLYLVGMGVVFLFAIIYKNDASDQVGYSTEDFDGLVPHALADVAGGAGDDMGDGGGGGDTGGGGGS